MLQQYSATNDRLRALARERLQLLRTPEGAIAQLDGAKLDEYTTERIGEIDRQMPQLMRRHEIIHNAVLAEYSAILILVVSMVVIAVSAATRSSPTATAALILFLGATLAMLAGIALIASEIRLSKAAVSYEARRVLMLGK
jgi:Protein of unknown function (DUF2721)